MHPEYVDHQTPTSGYQQGPTCESMFIRLLDLLATFLLEVMGGAGAVWGCAENMGVRFGPINDEWRAICWCVFLLCLFRWVMREAYGVTSHDGEVMAVFLLDVMGGAGAMWGCLEIGGYRVNYPRNCKDYQEELGFQGIDNAWGPQYSFCGNTYSNSRIICAVVFVLCALSWQKVIPYGPSCCGRYAEFLLRTFLLEVMGGAGALWGFSEICGRSGHSLRLGWGDKYFGQKSFDFWRIWCSIVFGLCLLRWLNIRVMRGPPLGWNGHKSVGSDPVDVELSDTTELGHHLSRGVLLL